AHHCRHSPEFWRIRLRHTGVCLLLGRLFDCGAIDLATECQPILLERGAAAQGAKQAQRVWLAADFSRVGRTSEDRRFQRPSLLWRPILAAAGAFERGVPEPLVQSYGILLGIALPPLLQDW